MGVIAKQPQEWQTPTRRSTTQVFDCPLGSDGQGVHSAIDNFSLLNLV